jgi:hypothetical protein
LGIQPWQHRLDCGQTNIDIIPLPPDILIVQDRSLASWPAAALARRAGPHRRTRLSSLRHK